ncbi:MAG: hemerythrin domain-containing protein [Magnetococcales bacterium]|nr:hemerythrin domain-containing protein [Magnetococcales bacterium]MBF0261370.1 hemerythrin domain-containing protein [Magnetococcales bacterium]
MNNTVLNLTGVDDATRLERLSAGFASLTEGGALELIGDGSFATLLEPFQASDWGAFDWLPLENGPERWRVAVRRVPGGQMRGIGEFMGFDHERCDELYAAMENAAQAGDLETTRHCFTAFQVAMTHHFDMEEKRFFPAFEQATGMTQGPTMVMRMEHRQMLGVIGQMGQALAGGDVSGVARAGTTLMVLMRQHNIKEEQMLYPMGDMHLGNVQPLLKAMQAV